MKSRANRNGKIKGTVLVISSDLKEGHVRFTTALLKLFKSGESRCFSILKSKIQLNYTFLIDNFFYFHNIC